MALGSQTRMPLQSVQRSILNTQSFAVVWVTGWSGAYGLGSEGSSVRDDVLASFIRLPSQWRIEDSSFTTPTKKISRGDRNRLYTAMHGGKMRNDGC